MIALGIDTGGTYTDAVIYDFEHRDILAYAKDLTTHQNLTIGIQGVLGKLPKEGLEKVRFLALSTTLATNACVEGKGGRAKLIFIGVDRKTVEENYRSYGLPSPKEIYFFEAVMEGEQACRVEPDWAEFRRNLKAEFGDCDGVAITQLLPLKNHAAFERKAAQIVTEELGIPCIMGYELFQEKNVMQRGASALLNARLLPVIKEFLDSVKESLAKQRLSLPVVIVRSDGSLMSEAYAGEHPIDTLLCGPAASILGANELTDEMNAVIVDMGGTTSDVAMIKNHEPIYVTNGVRVGGWKTFVKGLFIDTFGLGGDSEVILSEGTLKLTANRVIPLCVLAKQYPYVTTKLAELVNVKKRHTKPLYSFYVLQKKIEKPENYSTQEIALCDALAGGPLMYEDAATALMCDIYNIHTKRLEEEGIILRAGVTPTDAMHVKGEFTGFDAEASHLGLTFLGAGIEKNKESCAEEIYRLVTVKLYCSLARILLKDRNKNWKDKELNAMEQLYLDAANAAYDSSSQFFQPEFSMNAVLIGVGAPIHIFLPKVAQMFGTKAYLSEYSKVANALGAVIGNVTSSRTVHIRPRSETVDGDFKTGFFIEEGDEQWIFDELETAEAAAYELAYTLACYDARSQGAVGELGVSCENKRIAPEIGYGDELFVEETVTVRVVGRIGIESCME